jgi:N-hydroxyarylamine O-acetyltransferase
MVPYRALRAGKVVERRRGGFCYELNGLFAALLRALGFQVAMLSARVARADGTFSPDFDHMALAVTLEERWLADVGFGDSFRDPLRLDVREVQPESGRALRIDEDGGHHLLLRRDGAGEPWQPQYRFTLQPYEYADYAAMCHFHQTSPDSHFTRQTVCSLATLSWFDQMPELLLQEPEHHHKPFEPLAWR